MESKRKDRTGKQMNGTGRKEEQRKGKITKGKGSETGARKVKGSYR